jgi:fatty acid desaturase
MTRLTDAGDAHATRAMTEAASVASVASEPNQPSDSNVRAMPLSPAELRPLLGRSDRKGLLRLAGHLAAIAATGALYAMSLMHGWHFAWVALGAISLGFALVTMFAAMHECVHRTAFERRWLNDSVGWIAGLLSFYNSTFYRYYHGWHHRFTQLPGRDPELEDGKPHDLVSYAVELSGIPWWLGKLRTHVRIALGKTGGYGFLNERTRPLCVRSVRLQLAVYGAAITGSAAFAETWFLTYWLVPVAVAQPLLRAILLAEHTGCSGDGDGLANTRTTCTTAPVRFLMWEMPYHAEHHLAPALPFFALSRAHARVAPQLRHVARCGYFGFHVALVKRLWQQSSNLRPAP